MEYQYNYSIIIPHYNIPDLLMRCLHSIPVRPDVQVIVVDDCSPGADKYIEQYPELSRPYLEFYSTPRGGSAGRARNVGLDHAKGKWVICMDADDLFVDNMEEILDEAVNQKEDILFYNYKSVYSDDLTKAASRTFYSGLFEKYKRDFDDSDFRYRFHSIWGKIVKRTLIQSCHIRCSETKYSNDVFFSLQCGVNAHKIAVVDKPFFVVTERAGSLASSQFSRKSVSLLELRERFEVALKCQDYIDKHGLKVDLEQYKSNAMAYFHCYHISFVFYYFTVIFNFPRLANEIAKRWLAEKRA